MSTVKTLVDALKVNTNAFLVDYTELSNAYKVEDNLREETDNGYAIRCGDITLTGGNIGFNTVDQEFSTLLTKGYLTTKEGDIEKQECIIDLQDLAHTCYDNYVITKLGLSNTIIIIDDMSVTIEEFDEDKFVMATMTFTIKYRKRVSC